MEIHLTHQAREQQAAARSRADYLARGGILAAGLVCLFLLAWGHLGLSALFFPPVSVIPQQTAVVGPYTLTFQLTRGQLTARGPNTLTLRLRDQAGHAINDARLAVTPAMTTMPMTVPTVEGLAQGAGVYLIHPLFGMAGDWQLNITIAAPGQPDAQASFPVGVRWS